MSRSFRELWENAHGMPKEQSLEIIKRGIEARPDRSEGNTFWDDFMVVFGNNVDDASKFFDVSPDIVAQWSGKVKKALDQVRQEGGSEEKKRAEVLPTGI